MSKKENKKAAKKKEKEQKKPRVEQQATEESLAGDIKPPLDIPDELSLQESAKLLQNQLDKVEELKQKSIEDPDYAKWREETLYVVLKTCTEGSVYYNMIYNSFELDLQNPQAFKLVPQTYHILLEERASILQQIIEKFQQAISEQKSENQ